MKLVMVLHAHQPPGNFDSVFRRAVERCYGPVLDLVEAHPAVRLSMHWSGSLLEWLEAHAPERIEQIRRLVARDQVELVAAGMYEPVLALIPPEDRLGQIEEHRRFLADRFGRETSLGWLTERVWEPALAEDLVRAGIDAVTLDDQHLMAAGANPDELDAPYYTEAQGRVLRVAPVAAALRLGIPWKPVDDVIEWLRDQAAAGTRMAVYADDIEKFGMWPGTYEAVIRDGWLAEFFQRVTDLDTVEWAPLGEAVDAVPSRGLIYIPDGAYPEMLEWSLPAEAQRRLRRVRDALEEEPRQALAPFLRAGQFRQFLAKYPEVNHLQKRATDISRRLTAVEAMAGADRERREAVHATRRELWRAQANCAYWHGLFGGAYLPHLRQRLWRHLLRAEEGLLSLEPRPSEPYRLVDLDADGAREVMVTTPALTAVVDPGEGMVVELSHRPAGVNLADTMARRTEAYHDPGDPPYLYDRTRRGWFIDHLIAEEEPPSHSHGVTDVGDFEGAPYECEVVTSGSTVEVHLDRTGTADDVPVHIHKELRLPRSGSTIEAAYAVTTRSPEPPATLARGFTAPVSFSGRFGVSLNLGLLFTESPRGELHLGEARYSLPDGTAGGHADGLLIRLEGVPVGVAVGIWPPAEIDVRPIATVSRSESGFEETDQQLAVLVSWPVHLQRDHPFRSTIHVKVEDLREGR